ncbi:MAG: hypothetical protein HQL51_12525 [Magnetococcales bacterium]|nr:hypothetical protein [Magnetococcales bacterium]
MAIAKSAAPLVPTPSTPRKSALGRRTIASPGTASGDPPPRDAPAVLPPVPPKRPRRRVEASGTPGGEPVSSPPSPPSPPSLPPAFVPPSTVGPTGLAAPDVAAAIHEPVPLSDEAIMALLRQTAVLAMTTLQAVMKDPEATHGAKVSAANAALGRFLSRTGGESVEPENKVEFIIYE